MRKAIWTTLAGIAGAAVAYFVDPVQGRTRRTRSRDQLMAFLRRTGRSAGRLGRRAGGEASGVWHQATHGGEVEKDLDDATLAHKVMSEVLGSEDVAKGSIVVNVENGVAVLRGEAEDEHQIQELERRTRAVVGVAGVHNLLHVPGTTAPNKAPARRASGGSRETS